MSWRIVHEPEADVAGTGLRFTDVLFGFVFTQLFTRLTDWSSLAWPIRSHLITGTVLVIGSYIGFRNSVNRGEWKLFFFNLPLLRFLLDQCMVVLYFRFATTTPSPYISSSAPPTEQLVRGDLHLGFPAPRILPARGFWQARSPERDTDTSMDATSPIGSSCVATARARIRACEGSSGTGSHRP